MEWFDRTCLAEPGTGDSYLSRGQDDDEEFGESQLHLWEDSLVNRLGSVGRTEMKQE